MLVVQRVELEPVHIGVFQRPRLAALINLVVNPIDRDRGIVRPGHGQQNPPVHVQHAGLVLPPDGSGRRFVHLHDVKSA